MSRVAAVLLAAGRGTRFGGDKLSAMLDGRPLGSHAAERVAELPVAWRFAVVAGGEAPPGFVAIHNPDGGQGRSLALGLDAARRAGATTALVVLADMPFVSREHLERVLACDRGTGTLVASGQGGLRLPPALIGGDWFGALEGLTGDRGARDLLAGASVVDAPPHELLDIDTPGDLAWAERRLDGRPDAASGQPFTPPPRMPLK